MKAFLIDPKANTITEIDLPATGARLKALQDLVEGYIEPLRVFDDGDLIWINEEGRLRAEMSAYGFTLVNPDRFEWTGEVIHGRGVVVGHASRGEESEPKITIERLSAAVKMFNHLKEA